MGSDDDVGFASSSSGKSILSLVIPLFITMAIIDCVTLCATVVGTCVPLGNGFYMMMSLSTPAPRVLC